MIDEGTRPLDGQFRLATSYSTNDDSATHDTATNTSAKQKPQATAPRVMTDRKLVLPLKVQGSYMLNLNFQTI